MLDVERKQIFGHGSLPVQVYTNCGNVQREMRSKYSYQNLSRQACPLASLENFQDHSRQI